MTTSPPDAPPMDHATAEHIATVALAPGGCVTQVGPRVLAALLRRITELETARMLLRRELDALAMRALEDARLRAHAMFVEQRGGAQ